MSKHSEIQEQINFEKNEKKLCQKILEVGIRAFFLWMLKVAIKHEQWTQKECLTVLIPMF